MYLRPDHRVDHGSSSLDICQVFGSATSFDTYSVVTQHHADYARTTYYSSVMCELTRVRTGSHVPAYHWLFLSFGSLSKVKTIKFYTNVISIG